MSKVHSLSLENALDPGADLWVISETSSAIFRRLDWFLNFQMRRALTHQSRLLAPRVYEILKKCELSSYDFIEATERSTPFSHWLIGAMGFLPCRWVLISPTPEAGNSADIKAWWESVQGKLQSLHVTNVRFFPSEVLSEKNRGTKLSYLADVNYSFVSSSAEEKATWI